MTDEIGAHMITISRDDLREMMAEETTKAVRAAFADVGLYPDNADERREVREDFRHLRRWRQATDAAAAKVGNAILLAVVSGLLVAVWLGLKVHLLRQP